MTTTSRSTRLRVTRRAISPDGTQLVQIDALAREAGLHPELVRRFVALGLLEPRGGAPQAPLFPRDAAARLARAARLRRDLGLNYAGAVLACDLLARTVAARFLCSGTHLGKWRGHAPTGRRFRVDEVYFFQFTDGRIAGAWGMEDTARRLKQLGLAG